MDDTKRKLRIQYDDFAAKMYLDGELIYDYRYDAQYMFESLCEVLGVELEYQYNEETLDEKSL